MRSTSRRFFSCASGRGAYDRIRLKKHTAPNKLRAAEQVAEWLKAPVSKTGIPVNPVSRVRISPCPLVVKCDRRGGLQEPSRRFFCCAVGIARMGGRAVQGARLESVFRRKAIAGSN